MLYEKYKRLIALEDDHTADQTERLALTVEVCEAVVKLVNQRLRGLAGDGVFHLRVEFAERQGRTCLEIYKPVFNTIYNRQWFNPRRMSVKQGIFLQLEPEGTWQAAYTSHNALFGVGNAPEHRSRFQRVAYTILP